MSLGSNVNTISDLMFFIFILVSVGLGWAAGYYKGLIHGHEHAIGEMSNESDILNVAFDPLDEDEENFVFVDMLTDKIIASGPFDSVVTEIISNNKHRKVIFSKVTMEIDTDE